MNDDETVEERFERVRIEQRAEAITIVTAHLSQRAAFERSADWLDDPELEAESELADTTLVRVLEERDALDAEPLVEMLASILSDFVDALAMLIVLDEDVRLPDLALTLWGRYVREGCDALGPPTFGTDDDA